MMKPRKFVIYQICIAILCLLTNNTNSENLNYEDDLADFHFETGRTTENQSKYFDDNENESDMFDDFVGIDDTEIPNHKNQLIIKEKLLRTALVKALTNKSLRQKFVEVIPILRVLSSQQRLALSALISAQITAKPGTELKLDQVRTMFGNSKKLILPLVFDIANLVRNAAKSTLHFQYELNPQKNQKSHFIENPIISRRDFELTQDEEDTDTMDGVIDAKVINHELSENLSPIKFPDVKHVRSKRSVLLKQQQQDHRIFHERKLNISSFIGPNKQLPDHIQNQNNLNIISNSTDAIIFNINPVEDLALADLNDTNTNQFNLNITSHQTGEELPTPESLIGGPRLKKIGNNYIGMGSSLRKGSNKSPLIRPRPPVHPVTPKSCERFTASMCIRANDYPTDQIMGSIRRHKHAMSALLAEYRDKAAELEYQEYLEELNLNSKRREDQQNDVMPGGMCTSIVRYARPQKARSATGEWKFIVNTGQHTQTLRLEKCSNPQEGCSYLSENYRSRCLQVYNYHRLLSWDKNRGLHVDIFKIPSCCSCHVDGYRESFPPLGGIKTKDYTPIKNYNNVNNDFGNGDIDYEEEEEEDDDDNSDLIDESDSLAYQFSNGFKRVRQPPTSNQFDPNDFLQLSSNKHFETVKKTNPTLGTYLRPPNQNEFEHQPVFNRGSNQFSNNFYSDLKTRNRRPSLKNYIRNADNRSDLDLSGTNVRKEVTVYPTDEKTTLIHPNRKHISSVSTVKTTKFTPSVQYTSPTPYANIRGRKKTNNITPTILSSPAITTTTIPKSSSTIRTKHQHPIYSTKLTNIKLDNGENKRINYNYHPIIDFFEDEESSSLSSSLATLTLPKNYRGSSNYKTSSVIKDNRIGVGLLDDSNWHPVIA